MWRNGLIYLDIWFKKSPRKPLVIRGARQVGKSTLVRQFAAAQKLRLIEINLERRIELDPIFASLNMSEIIAALETVAKGQSLASPGLLFLDEIQATPHALAALRYFYEDRPDIMVIAAGSLLEFVIADHDFSMPVGRIEFLHLGPMNFSEYLVARGEAKLVKILESSVSEISTADIAHMRLLSEWRRYCYIGGMPEAVRIANETDSMARVREVHDSIVDTYKDDFSKYGKKKQLPLLSRVFDYAARHVGQKVKYATISRDERSASVKAVIDLLCFARVVQRVHHSHAQGLPLLGDIEEHLYKLLFLDVGLVNAIVKLSWSDIAGAGTDALINAGAISDQFVGQELCNSELYRSKPELTYWIREGKAGNAEVDYVVNLGSRIIPIEVKSGKSGTLRSIHQFLMSHKSLLAIRFDANPPSVQPLMINGKKRHLVSLPIYAAGQLLHFRHPG